MQGNKKQRKSSGNFKQHQNKIDIVVMIYQFHPVHGENWGNQQNIKQTYEVEDDVLVVKMPIDIFQFRITTSHESEIKYC